MDQLSGVDEVGFMAECDATGTTNQCAEGLACVIMFEGDTTGQCMQMCDSTLEGTGELAHCPAGPPDPFMVDGNGLFPYIAFRESLSSSVDVMADETISLHEEGAPADIVADLVGIDLAAGTANTIFAFNSLNPLIPSSLRSS